VEIVHAHPALACLKAAYALSANNLAETAFRAALSILKREGVV
jgi:hypothetical protein